MFHRDREGAECQALVTSVYSNKEHTLELRGTCTNQLQGQAEAKVLTRKKEQIPKDSL